MSEKAKLNAVLLLQLATFAGLAFAYWKLLPIIDKVNTTLDNTNELENKVGKLFG